VWGDPARHADVWASHDPYALADRLTDIPLYVSAGNGEFYGAGTHSWPYWARELERSLPMLLSALGENSRSERVARPVR
jgi:diacylglycerol O-acyltransferase / trehalose O-mycolyltransferase